MKRMRIFRSYHGLMIFGLLAVLLNVSTMVTAQDSRPVFSYPIDPDALIISYNATPEMFENPDLIPRIRVYGDGWVKVHYPVYMKKSGDYEVQLNPGEIRQLLLALSGVFDFDPQAIKRSKKAIKEVRQQQTGIMYHRSDDTLEQIDVQLDTYQETSSANARGIQLKLSWKNINADAKTHPEVAALQSLKGASDSLRALLKRNDLTKVNVSVGGSVK